MYLHQIYFFRQITTFIKVRVVYVFGLQALLLIDLSKIYQLRGLKPKKKGPTNFYECCDLTKKVYLMQVGIISTDKTSQIQNHTLPENQLQVRKLFCSIESNFIKNFTMSLSFGNVKRKKANFLNVKIAMDIFISQIASFLIKGKRMHLDLKGAL